MRTYYKIKLDLWFGIATILFSLVFAVSILSIEVVIQGSAVTGRTFPWLVACFTFILGLSLTASSYKELQGFRGEPGGNVYNKQQLNKIALYLALICLYVLGISFIGYMVSTAIFVAALLIFFGYRKKVIFLSLVLLLPVLMWYAFSQLIEVQFPEALLF